MLGLLGTALVSGAATNQAMKDGSGYWTIDEKKEDGVWNDYRTYIAVGGVAAGAAIGGEAGAALAMVGVGSGLSIINTEVAVRAAKSAAENERKALEAGEGGGRSGALLPNPLSNNVAWMGDSPAYGFHQVPAQQAYPQGQAFGCAPAPVQHYQPGPYTYAGQAGYYGQQAPIPAPL